MDFKISVLFFWMFITTCHSYTLNTIDLQDTELQVFDFEFLKKSECACLMHFAANRTAVSLTIEPKGEDFICKLSSDDSTCTSSHKTKDRSVTYLKSSFCGPTTTTPLPTTTTAPPMPPHNYYLSKSLYQHGSNITNACGDGQFGVISSDTDLNLVVSSFHKQGLRLYISQDTPSKNFDGSVFLEDPIEGEIDGGLSCAKIKHDFSKVTLGECSEDTFSMWIPAVCVDSEGAVFLSRTLLIHGMSIVEACAAEAGEPHKITSKNDLMVLEEAYMYHMILAIDFDKATERGTWVQDGSPLIGHAVDYKDNRPVCSSLKTDGNKVEVKNCDEYPAQYPVLCQMPM